MARTAPVPNIPPIPGMCPSVAVMGGGGSGGGGSGGSGNGANGDGSAGGDGSADGAAGDGTGAGACGNGSTGGCTQCQPGASAGHPIDVATGRVFTPAEVDLEVPGCVVPLVFLRCYNSAARDHDVGLGAGWGHSLGWRLYEKRTTIDLWTSEARKVTFQRVPAGEPSVSHGGFLLEPTPDGGYRLDVNAEIVRYFSPAPGEPHIFLLTAMVDQAGNRTTLVYDDRGILVTDTAGRQFLLSLDAERHIDAISLLGANRRDLVRYHYQDGNLVTVARPCNYVLRYAYDDQHRMVMEQRPDGLTYRFCYDRRGRGVETWGEYPGGVDAALDPELPPVLADGETRAKGIFHVKIVYGDDGYAEVVSASRVDRFFGNARGAIDKAVVGGAVTSWTYDERGHPARMVDPAGGATLYAYDERGRLLSATDPDGRISRIERRADGLMVRRIDPAGHAWEYTRTPGGLVTSMRMPSGATFVVKRDERGLIREEHTPMGATIRYTYDAHGNPVRIDAGEGRTWSFTYDDLGRRITSTDPFGRITRVTLNEAGWPVSWVDAAGATVSYGYDAAGRLTQQVDADGRAYTFAWAGASWLTAIHYPNGAVYRQVFDREGQLLRVIAPNGESYRNRHDALGRVVESTNPDGSSVAFVHDPVGRIVRVTASDRSTIDYTYAPSGDLLAAEYSDGRTETFAYDVRGLLVAATAPEYALTFAYDPDRELVGETQRVGDEQCEIVYQRDGLGLCTRLETSWGHARSIRRDGRGLVEKLELDGVDIAVRRDLRDRLVAYETPGLTVRLDHDLQDRLVGREARDRTGRSLLAQKIAFSLAGHVLHRSVESIAGDEAEAFLYDVNGRLTEHDKAGVVRRFQYDAVDNLFEVGGPPRRYGAGGRLEQMAGEALHWDDKGRLVAEAGPRPKGERTLTWNDRNTLCTVASGATTSRRVTDFNGRLLLERIHDAQTGKTTTVRFVWADGSLVHRRTREGDAAPEVTTFYTEGAHLFGPRFMKRRDTWYWIATHTNEMPFAVVDLGGTSVERIESDVWGEVTKATGDAAADVPFRFAGQLATASGPVANRLRHYDGAKGRYLSRDPAGHLGGFAAYAYCINPVGWADPMGLMLMQVTTDAPGVNVNDPTPMPFSYNGDAPTYTPAANEWRNFPRASMGREGDCERRIMDNLDPTGQGNPALRDRTVNMHCLGEPESNNPNDGVRYPPEGPCATCRPRLRAFAVRNGCTVNYTRADGGEPWTFHPDGTVTHRGIRRDPTLQQ